MLDALRAATQNWLGRIIMAIVMGLLVIAFGFWGIGDIFRGFGANDLARVGSQTISVQDFRTAYQTELQNLERRSRRAITNAEARRMGLDRQILAQLISDAILNQEAHRLGLAISDHVLAEKIMRDPAFHNAKGKFDRQVFENRLEDAGFTEQSYVARQRHAYLRRQLVTALTQGIAVPKAMRAAIHRFYSETRSIDYLVLPRSAVGKIAPPSDKTLKAYYEVRKQTYRTPEYRKVVVLVLTLKSLAEQVAKTHPITEADLKKYYDKVKAQRFIVPEKRHIEQIVFPSKAAALAAAKKLAGGESFDALVASLKLTKKDVDLGTISKTDLADKAIADVAFSLPVGKISAPVKGKFGWVLLRVEKIVPGAVTPFQKVELELRQELLMVRAHREINKIHDKISDARDAGKTLVEAAKSVGLSVRTIDSMDSEGYTDKRVPITDIPDLEALVKAVFASDIGVDNEPISTRNGGTIWFSVTGITPARQQSFAEVKQQVTKSWTEDQTDQRLAAQAKALVKKLKGGTALSALAKDNHLKVQHKDGVKRSGGGGLAPGLVAEIFDHKVGGVGSATDTSGNRVIFKVLDAKVPPINPKSARFNKVLASVKQDLGADIVDQYLIKLEHDLGVSVNQQALKTAVGGS